MFCEHLRKKGLQPKSARHHKMFCQINDNTNVLADWFLMKNDERTKVGQTKNKNSQKRD